MTAEIIGELNAVQKTSEITNEQVLAWTKRAEVLIALNVIMGPAKHNKDFDAMQWHKQKRKTPFRAKSTRRETLINYKYCGHSHRQRQFPTYGERHSRCAKGNHF